MSELERLAKKLDTVTVTFDAETTVTLNGPTTFIVGTAEDVVRAILTAMREPSSLTKQAGAYHLDHFIQTELIRERWTIEDQHRECFVGEPSHDPDAINDLADEMSAEAVHQAMIDHILSGGE